MNQSLLRALLEIKPLTDALKLTQTRSPAPKQKADWKNLLENPENIELKKQVINFIDEMQAIINDSATDFSGAFDEEKTASPAQMNDFLTALSELSETNPTQMDDLLEKFPHLETILSQEVKPILRNIQSVKYELVSDTYSKDDEALIKNLHTLYNYNLKYPNENIVDRLKTYSEEDPETYKKGVDELIEKLKTFFAEMAKTRIQLSPQVFANNTHKFLQDNVGIPNFFNARSFLMGHIYQALAVAKQGGADLNADLLLKEAIVREDARRQKLMHTADMPPKANIQLLKEKMEKQNLIDEFVRIINAVKNSDLNLNLDVLLSEFAADEAAVQVKYFLQPYLYSVDESESVYTSNKDFAKDVDDLFATKDGVIIKDFLTKNMAAILKKITFAEKQKEAIDFLVEMYGFFDKNNNKTILQTFSIGVKPNAETPAELKNKQAAVELEALFSEKVDNVTSFKVKAAEYFSKDNYLPAFILMNKNKVQWLMDTYDFLVEIYIFLENGGNRAVLDEFAAEDRRQHAAGIKNVLYEKERDVIHKKTITLLKELFNRKFDSLDNFKSAMAEILDPKKDLKGLDLVLTNKARIKALMRQPKQAQQTVVTDKPVVLQSVVHEGIPASDLIKSLGGSNLRGKLAANKLAAQDENYNPDEEVSIFRKIINYIKNNPFKFIFGISVGMVAFGAFVIACVVTGGGLAATFPLLAPLILNTVALVDLISLPAVVAIGVVVGGLLGALITTAFDKVAEGIERIIRAIVFAMRSTEVNVNKNIINEGGEGAHIERGRVQTNESHSQYDHGFAQQAAEAKDTKLSKKSDQVVSSPEEPKNTPHPGGHS